MTIIVGAAQIAAYETELDWVLFFEDCKEPDSLIALEGEK